MTAFVTPTTTADTSQNASLAFVLFTFSTYLKKQKQKTEHSYKAIIFIPKRPWKWLGNSPKLCIIQMN